MLRVYKPRHGQTVFHAAVCDGVPARQNTAGFRYFFGTAAQDLAQDVQIHAFRETNEIQSCFHLAAHGVDIAQRVGRRDLPEGIGVIHHRRKKVHGLHERHVFRDAVDGCIIPAVIPHQKVRVFLTPGQLFQNMAQHACSKLCRAAASGAEHDFFFFVHARSPSLKCVRTPVI